MSYCCINSNDLQNSFDPLALGKLPLPPAIKIEMPSKVNVAAGHVENDAYYFLEILLSLKKGTFWIVTILVRLNLFSA